MKTFLFAAAVIFVSALAATNGAYAQTAVNIAVLEASKDSKTDTVIPEVSNTVNISAVSAKAIKGFKKFYKEAVNESWYRSTEGFNARFTSNGISNLVYYSPKGKWLGSMKTYGEDKLPHDIRHAVKSQYYDYTITSVQEIETLNSEGGPTYIVHIEDGNNIKLIRISNDDMDVYKEFKEQ